MATGNAPWFNRQMLAASWRSWLSSDYRRVGPVWLQLLWTVLFCVVVAAGFTVLGFGLFARSQDAWRDVHGWALAYWINLQVSLVIGFVIHALFALGARGLGMDRIRGLHGLARTLYFTGMPLLGVAIGWPLGAWLTRSQYVDWEALNNPNAVAASVLISLLIVVIFHFFFAAKARQMQAEKRATEARLRLLQGQIEPHFLFNTLANVLALMDEDTPKARRMLETFTDYLRSSLGSLRDEQATLGSELQLLQAYLSLLKHRMEDRLQFHIQLDPRLHAARLPPLLLQPLVENAIHHGIEPKVEGGQVRISAHLQDKTLVIEVADNGLGLGDSPRRRGAGMALANLRERLLAHYGNEASLELHPGHPGTVATVKLPFETRASA